MAAARPRAPQRPFWAPGDAEPAEENNETRAKESLRSERQNVIMCILCPNLPGGAQEEAPRSAQRGATPCLPKRRDNVKTC